MPRISEDTIQRVAAASDVVDVIGSYLQLKRAGANWKGLCPFHNEKTPSFHVNPARQTFKCFGCGAGGSIFRFVMDYEHVDYPTAVRKLAARAGISVAEESADDEARRGERDRLIALHRSATAWFHENLMRQKFAAPAREYLKSRGIDSGIAARWQIGFAPDNWNALAIWGQSAGYTEVELLKAGLVLARERDASIYDRFRNRVMFPIANDYGEVIAFSGRTLGKDPAKYVNSPETAIFTKGHMLFGLEKTKRAILAANEAIVCEGQLDLISAFEAGVENVTAPQGTAFTPQQARLLRRFSESVVLCFDSDIAGRKAVERSLPALLGVGIAVRVARMPAGEDPDSLVRNQGIEALRILIKEAKEYFDDVLDNDVPLAQTPRAKAAIARKLVDWVHLIREPTYREEALKRVKLRLELSLDVFNQILREKRRERIPTSEVLGEENFTQDSIVLSEPAQLLCRLAILSPQARQWIREQPHSAASFGSEYALVDRLVRTDVALEEITNFTSFVASLPAPEERALAGLRLGKVPENPVERVADAWKGLLRLKLVNEITSLQTRMRHPATQPEECAALHKQILDLQELLRNT